jgi:hypothetical protein
MVLHIKIKDTTVNPPANFSDLFLSSDTAAETHTWTLVKHDPASFPVADLLAQMLADKIMKHLCRGCPHHYQAWKQCSSDGSPLPEASQQILKEAFIGPIFGLPENPDAVPTAHLEGFVGQMVWYFLYLESPPEELIRVEPPGFKATDPGGDSLAIHRINGDYLMFRLWEIKKFAGDPTLGTASVSSTISTAYSQLDANALEYLARYTAIGQEVADPVLADFYGRLIDYWIEAQKEASVGVSVVTSLCYVPQQCFTTFGDRFPKFVTPVRLRGMLAAIGDFSSFVTTVRNYIWTGL